MKTTPWKRTLESEILKNRQTGSTVQVAPVAAPDAPIATPIELRASASPVRVIRDDKYAKGTCSLCGRPLGSSVTFNVKPRARIVRLSAQQMLDPGTGEVMEVCRACHAFFANEIFADRDQAKAYVRTRWSAMNPSEPYNTTRIE